MYDSVGSGWGDDDWALNAGAMRIVFAGEDTKEGPRAFAAERAPQWSGR